ncbi:MAG: prepilin-type N-terminal cleavage/methylation domain-containing protein [Sterolibacterium sp.]|nr:prepilin-type N-terminal cleavage/methylation domain-containing protein [Sterolibacterium sp.]MBP9799358.1 prepilin-type N-terminal cleavage/methylation domain-containing protein [Sterolibacterium sp.]
MHKQSGFTLVELMIAVIVVAVLTAVALPSYRSHVTSSRLTEAFSSLAAAQAASEQFWSNNRTYVGFDIATNFPQTTSNFTYALSNETTSTYTITADGVTGSPVDGFTFTVNQNGDRATTATPTGETSTTCWLYKQGGVCVQ